MHVGFPLQDLEFKTIFLSSTYDKKKANYPLVVDKHFSGSSMTNSGRNRSKNFIFFLFFFRWIIVQQNNKDQGAGQTFECAILYLYIYKYFFLPLPNMYEWKLIGHVKKKPAAQAAGADPSR